MKKTILEDITRLAGVKLDENYIYADDDSSDETEKKDDDDVNPEDKAEYDQEGRMAKNDLENIEDAANELRELLDDNENLPEWIQTKITKAVDYLDTARDYMKKNDVRYKDDSDHMSESEEEVEESGLQYYTGKKKYGKEGMEALAKAGRDGANQEELGRIRDKYNKKDEVKEAAKPDYIDLDGDGDKEESMKKAAHDKEDKDDEDRKVAEAIQRMKDIAGLK